MVSQLFWGLICAMNLILLPEQPIYKVQHGERVMGKIRRQIRTLTHFALVLLHLRVTIGDSRQKELVIAYLVQQMQMDGSILCYLLKALASIPHQQAPRKMVLMIITGGLAPCLV